MSHEAEKGLALLKSVAANCERDNGEHAWRRCRRCLAVEELDTVDGRRALRAFLREIEAK